MAATVRPLSSLTAAALLHQHHLHGFPWSVVLHRFPSITSSALLGRLSTYPDPFFQPSPFQNRNLSARAGFSSKSVSWSADESPYDILGVELNVDDDGIKSAYRRMVKQYHPDVYDGSVELEEGETPEARFIKIQAAYELLIDKEERRQYDYDNRTNPLKASKAWIEWIMKKKKAFEQRGELAVTAWAEQQQRELNLKARRMARHKMDPEEERRILAKEKQASAVNFESTLRRHTLVLKKRDIIRRKQEEKKLVQRLLAEEGLELADESDDD